MLHCNNNSSYTLEQDEALIPQPLDKAEKDVTKLFHNVKYLVCCECKVFICLASSSRQSKGPDDDGLDDGGAAEEEPLAALELEGAVVLVGKVVG